MNKYLATCLLLILGGCAAPKHEVCCSPCASARPSSYNPATPLERSVYKILLREPVSLPKRTPFDKVPAQRDMYLAQFHEGWIAAISGCAIRITFAYSGPRDLAEAAGAGWQEGVRLGGLRWLDMRNRLIREQQLKTDSSHRH